MSITIQKPDTSSRTKFLIDVDSNEPTKNSVHVEGNTGVLADILVQICEHPNNKGIIDVFDIAVREYYQRHPEEKSED